MGHAWAAYDRSHHPFRVFAVSETLIRVMTEPKMSGNQQPVHCTDSTVQGDRGGKFTPLEDFQVMFDDSETAKLLYTLWERLWKLV